MIPRGSFPLGGWVLGMKRESPQTLRTSRTSRTSQTSRTWGTLITEFTLYFCWNNSTTDERGSKINNCPLLVLYSSKTIGRISYRQIRNCGEDNPVWINFTTAEIDDRSEILIATHFSFCDRCY